MREMLNVYWNHYLDHSHYRFARRLQRHRRRPVLRHRILWRRRPRPGYRYSADPAAAREDLSCAAIFIVIRDARNASPNPITTIGRLDSGPAPSAHPRCAIAHRGMTTTMVTPLS